MHAMHTHAHGIHFCFFRKQLWKTDLLFNTVWRWRERKKTILTQEKHIFTPLKKQSLCKTDFCFQLNLSYISWNSITRIYYALKIEAKNGYFKVTSLFSSEQIDFFTLSNNESDEKNCSKYFCGVYGQRHFLTLFHRKYLLSLFTNK